MVILFHNGHPLLLLKVDRAAFLSKGEGARVLAHRCAIAFGDLPSEVIMNS